jgi:peptidyl-prolyl cis-trans isomerase C
MAELLFKKFTEGKQPTDAELKTEYDARIAEARKRSTTPATSSSTRKRAKDLIAQLDKGGDFAKLAKDNSRMVRQPKAATWLVQSEPDGEAFSDAVKQLEIGKYTPCRQSEFGWHVIAGGSAQPRRLFDAVKSQLGPLVQQKQFETPQGPGEDGEVERSPDYFASRKHFE